MATLSRTGERPTSQTHLTLARVAALATSCAAAFAVGLGISTEAFASGGSMAGLYHPLPTLHRWPRSHRCTARGRCGSLFLHRVGLSPTTPCRSPGAQSLEIITMNITFTSRSAAALRENDQANRRPPMLSSTNTHGGT